MTPPNSKAFIPSVVTIGVIPTLLTMNPERSPAPTRTRNASATAVPSFVLSPFGILVRMTTPREIIPGTDEVDPALLDHERLARGDNRQDRGEREHP